MRVQQSRQGRVIVERARGAGLLPRVGQGWCRETHSDHLPSCWGSIGGHFFLGPSPSVPHLLGLRSRLDHWGLGCDRLDIEFGHTDPQRLGQSNNRRPARHPVTGFVPRDRRGQRLWPCI
jgi:hypothetical protein